MKRPEDMAPRELRAFVKRALAAAKGRKVPRDLRLWWESVRRTRPWERVR